MRILSIIGLVLVFSTWCLAGDSALVAAAKKEKERREKVKATKVITNEDVDEFIAKKRAAGEIPEETTTSSSDESDSNFDSDETTSTNSSVSKHTRPFYPSTVSPAAKDSGEQYWRNRKSDLESQIASARDEVNRLGSELSQEQSQRDGDGQYVRQYDANGNVKSQTYTGKDFWRDPEVMKKQEELTEKQQRLKELEQQMEDLPEQARKAGALPGWVRD